MRNTLVPQTAQAPWVAGRLLSSVTREALWTFPFGLPLEAVDVYHSCASKVEHILGERRRERKAG